MKLRYVGSAPFFAALSEQEQERISERMVLEQRRGGEVLFRKGEDSQALYLIQTGWVRLVANGGTVIASQGPGSLVGEADLFLERPHSLGATAAIAVELWALTREDLADLARQSPQIGVKLAHAFGARLPLMDGYLIEQRLRPLPILSGVSDRTLAAVACRLVPVDRAVGDSIVEEGQPPQGLFIVESGLVHLESLEAGGSPSEVGPGQTFGELALLTGKPHTHSAQAVSDVMLWLLPVVEYSRLTEEHPDLRLALSKNICLPLMAQDMGRAGARLSQIPLFEKLPEEALLAAAGRLLLRHAPAGEIVFFENTPGDALYVVDSGQVEIVANSRPGSPILARLGPDQFFGEMALLTGRPRSTAARAAAHTDLWVLYRSDFEDLVNRYPSISLALSRVLSERLEEMDRRFTESHLQGIKLLGGLSSSQLADVSQRLKPIRFREGETIIHEDAPGDEMFFVESGRVQVIEGHGSRAVVLAELGAGDAFGEMALLTGRPRCASVVALNEVNLWSVGRADFDGLVATYPSVALGLSRLLSERLQATDQRFLLKASPAVAVPARPRPRPAREPRRAGRPTAVASAEAARAERAQPRPVARPIRRLSARSLSAGVRETFESSVVWFGSLSRGAKIRLVVIALLLVWLTCIAAPALLISTLAADNVTNLTGAIAFVQRDPWPVVQAAAAAPAADLPQSSELGSRVLRLESAGGAAQEAELANAASGRSLASQAPESVAAAAVPSVAPSSTPVPPTATPWIIVVTNTPAPVTDTPVPPTATPVPPTRVVAKSSTAPKPQPTATPARKEPPPRDLDPRLGALNVGVVEPAGLAPGQAYWRLVKARWQDGNESGNDHTIYVEVLDENGTRVVGQPVEVRWADGMVTVFVEDKPPPIFGANFPMYATLGSYSVSIAGLPSDMMMGMGMGTPEQPKFNIHTNFFLTFQRSTY